MKVQETRQDTSEIRELTADEVNVVSGGAIPIIAGFLAFALGFAGGHVAMSAWGPMSSPMGSVPPM